MEDLKNFKPEKDFFIGFDSDGCVFDTMELKHKECFIPATVNVFELQGISKYLREVWGFVNLYSSTRGVNRFPGLLRSLDLLSKRKETKARKIHVPKLDGLRKWVENASVLGEKRLEEEVNKTGDPDLKQALLWTREVNAAVNKIVRNCPPFAGVREVLGEVSNKADMIVVSQTPVQSLQKEWKEHEIDGYPALIAGQEMGTKIQHLDYAAGGKYSPEKILMIGDAPGDLRAAKANKVLFYPINPGEEEKSWQRFKKEGLERFFKGTFAGEYQEKIIREFEALLPENPEWDNQ